jgi:hypothetical protein
MLERREDGASSFHPFVTTIPAIEDRRTIWQDAGGLQPDFDGALMIRFAIILSLLPVLAITATASAQTAAEKHKSECVRDVTRFCRSKMNDGDEIVLACLKQHRAKLSKRCARTLTEHGQ